MEENTKRESLPTLIDEKAAADALGISPATLRGLRAKGQAPAHYRIGASVRYSIEDLAAYLQDRRHD